MVPTLPDVPVNRQKWWLLQGFLGCITAFYTRTRAPRIPPQGRAMDGLFNHLTIIFFPLPLACGPETEYSSRLCILYGVRLFGHCG